MQIILYCNNNIVSNIITRSASVELTIDHVLYKFDVSFFSITVLCVLCVSVKTSYTAV